MKDIVKILLIALVLTVIDVGWTVPDMNHRTGMLYKRAFFQRMCSFLLREHTTVKYSKIRYYGKKSERA